MRRVLEDQIALWLGDPDSAVEYAEEVEDRWAVRVAQETRQATTVWFWPRQRSMEFEAYVLPLPATAFEAMRIALIRNGRAWRAFYALDDRGGLVLRGRMAAPEVTPINLDLVLGEIVEAVDVGFRTFLRALPQGRENSG